jgi:hypothetical protein
VGAPSDGNQGTLREAVEAFAAEQKANGFKDTKVSRHEMVEWFSATMNAACAPITRPPIYHAKEHGPQPHQ